MERVGDIYFVFLELFYVMWMLESLEFGIWSLYSRVAFYNMHLCFWTLDLLFAFFVFYLIWLGLQVGTWGGVVGGCMHTTIANGQNLLKLGFTSLSSACNCSVFIAKWFLPLINLDSQIMLCTSCLVTKHSFFI